MFPFKQSSITHPTTNRSAPRRTSVALVLLAATVLPAGSAFAAGTEDNPPTSTTIKANAPAPGGAATTTTPPPATVGTPPLAAGASDHYESGKLHITKSEWAAAIAELEQADKLQPNNADVNNLLGYSNRKLGKLDISLTYYQKALKITPKHKGANEYLGELYLMMNLPAKAKVQLATLAKICGKSCEEYLDLKGAIASYKPTAAIKKK